MRLEPSVLDRVDAARRVADEIAELVRTRETCVLGLATGATPVGVYRELVRMHGEEGLSFAGVTTFNLDEYRGLGADEAGSFRRWMREVLHERVGIPEERMHVPDGRVSGEELDAHCADYERRIQRAGGIDLQILGIGRNGHIGFNEPGSARASRTRRVELEARTREDASAYFGTVNDVPTEAVTMGVGTILEARRIRVLAFGARKREVVRRVLSGVVGSDVPATFLVAHPDVRLYADAEAAGGATRSAGS